MLAVDLGELLHRRLDVLVPVRHIHLAKLPDPRKRSSRGFSPAVRASRPTFRPSC